MTHGTPKVPVYRTCSDPYSAGLADGVRRFRGGRGPGGGPEVAANGTGLAGSSGIVRTPALSPGLPCRARPCRRRRPVGARRRLERLRRPHLPLRRLGPEQLGVGDGQLAVVTRRAQDVEDCVIGDARRVGQSAQIPGRDRRVRIEVAE